MSLSNNITVKQGITGVTLTGGTDVVFSNDGQGLAGKKSLIDTSNGNVNTRKKLITSVTVGYPGTTKNPMPKLHRATADLHQPFVDSNGVKSNLPMNFGLSYHPEQTQAQREAHFWNVIAVITDPELFPLFTNIVND